MHFLFQTIKTIFYWCAGLIILIVAFYLVLNLFTSPSNDRDWSPDQTTLSYAEIKDTKVSIYNIRNFVYASTTSYIPVYYNKTFDLNTIKRVWYVVEPFSGIPGSAHTFLSFEFEKEQFVAISAEIRKEKNETFSPIKGLFNRYELMYVIGDERDLIKLRANYRKDAVYVYPMKASPEKVRALFLDMITRTNMLKDSPEFYNSLYNTCTTNIVHHVNSITPDTVPFFNLRILLPENSDKLAYNLGLIDTTLSFEEARARYHVNDRALKYANDIHFSTKIRGEN